MGPEFGRCTMSTGGGHTDIWERFEWLLQLEQIIQKSFLIFKNDMDNYFCPL